MLDKTPEEMKELWCPVALFSIGEHSITRGAHSRMTCISSKCALWVEANTDPITLETSGHCGLIRG